MKNKYLNLIKLLLVLLPFGLIAQENNNSSDTLYYQEGRNGKTIKSIIQKTGHGKIITNYYRNGLVEFQETYSDSIIEKRQSYFENGEKQELCLYGKGLPIKKEKWHQNGLLAQLENFKITEKKDSLQSVLDGTFEIYYSNGLPQKKGHYKNNKKSGEWLDYYDNGKKKSEINYQEDVMDGKALFYYNSGQVKSENHYIANENFKNSKHETSSLLDGEQKYYFENGKLESISHYEKGKRSGLYESWNIAGVKKSETAYCFDVYCGTFKTWFENGTIEQNYSYGKPIYDSIGKAYKAVLDGKYEAYYNNSKPKQLGSFKLGKEDGTLIKFHENNIKASEQNFSEGLKNGPSKRWNRNGVLIESENYIIIKQNEKLVAVKEGEYLYYNEANQQIINQGFYKNGKKEGKWTNWHQNGKPAKVCYFENDLQVRASTIWNENGNLTSELFYAIDTVNGTPTSKPSYITKKYDNKGKIYLICFYNDLHESYHTKIFYEDGTLKAEWYNLLNSESNSPKFGKYTTYFSNGNIESESFNFNERPIGRTVNYFINGKPKSIIDFNDIRSSGKCGYEILWRSDGELISFKKYKDYKTFEVIKDPILAKQLYDNLLNKPKTKGEIINGVKEGLHISWFQPGIKWIEESFKNDKHEGTVRVYYPDGKIMLEMDLKNAIANGKLVLWDTNGNKYREENYLNEKKQGLFTVYYSNGKKENEWLYQADAKHYLFEKKWYENGNLYFVSNYNEAGIQQGESIGYCENGKINYQKNYLNGRLDGQEKYFYTSGKDKSSKFYKNGLLDGEFIHWLENGKIKEKTTYRNNIKEGYWEELNSDLTLTKGYYKLDEKDSVWTYYNAEGKLIRTETYKNGILQLKPAEPEKENMRAIHRCPAGEPSHAGFICQCSYSNSISQESRQIIFQETLETQTCQCIDSTKLKVTYAPQLSELATLEEVRKKSFNFHEPIGDFYNNLFYINYQFNTNRNDGLWCAFDLLAFEEIYLNIPDKNGIKLILNPCIKVGGNVSKMNMNMTIDRKDKTQTNATLTTKNLAIEFNPTLLHQWDKLNQAVIVSNLKTADKYVASKIIFDAPTITYSLGGRIGIDKYSNPCFTTSEIGKTGLLLDFKNMVLDLDNTQSPDEINKLFPSNQIKYEDYFDYENPARNTKKQSEPKINDDFVGIYVPEATILFPENIFKNASQKRIKVEGKNILIAGQYLIGTIKINAKAIEGQLYQIGHGAEKIIFDAATIEKELKSRGIEKLQTKYDAKNAQFVIYFYLTINS